MTTITLPVPQRTDPGRWQTQLIFVGRSLRHSVRHVDALVMGIALPVILMLLFVYIFGAAIDPSGGYVDVTGYASGQKVKDPYSGKIFLVP